MGIPEQRLRRKAEVKTQILRAAWSMVLQEGWPSLSLRRISEAIGFSVPVIYDHFENKEAILLEFSRQGFKLLGKKISAATGKRKDPRQQLLAIADAYWSFAFRNTAYYQLMFGLGMPAGDMAGFAEERHAFQKPAMMPIDLIMENNRKTRADAALNYHMFWSVLHGLVSIKMLGYDEAAGTLNKQVLGHAITGFIKNLEN